jgi:hypothetical protein
LGREWFPSLFRLPMLHLVLCNYVLDRLVGGFSHLFSFPLFNFVLWLYWVCNCYSVPGLGII